MNTTKERIVTSEYSELMEKSYIDYAMSVIVARALPDARDGLKPVQRRVLYDMKELGTHFDKPYRKSARIVGDTMGKYHPHGDNSIYDALVVMSQDFKRGLPLVDGHGNFGSIEGDGAAAMRYTEARLTKLAQEYYLADMDKDVVDFVPNFDETEKEPEVLPVRVPNLLVNGADGIAVGMTTSIPSHNLGEVVDAVKATIKNPDITLDKLMRYVPGPDFPTGGIVVNQSDLQEIYQSGQGKIKLRGKVSIEKLKGGREQIVVSEIPYTMVGNNIGKFLQDVANLVETKKTTDISDIANMSSKEGIRIVIELKKGANAQNIINLLYKKTKLEDTFGVNMLAVVDGKPETLSLKDIINHHIDFQFDVCTRKYRNLLGKEQAHREIQEGLIKACDCIDLIIEILRGSKSREQVKKCLVEGTTEGITFKSAKSKKEAASLHFTEKQADAILDMRLHRLIGLEIAALNKEHEETLKRIAQYEDILNNYDSMAKVICKDLDRIKKEFAKERKTVLEDADEVIVEAEPIKEMDVTVLIDRFGYARSVDRNVYEKNKEAADEENKYIIHCKNTDRISVLTDIGKQHLIKVMDLPYGRFRDKGIPIDNVSNYSTAQEVIVTIMALSDMKKQRLLFATAQGMMKLVDGAEFEVSRKEIAATKLNDNDKLIAVEPSVVERIHAVSEHSGQLSLEGSLVSPENSGEQTGAEALDDRDGEQVVLEAVEQVVLQTEAGVFLRFPLEEIPEKKKGAVGVKGISLGAKDTVAFVHTMTAGEDAVVMYQEKEIHLNRLKIAKRAGKGTKQRV